MHYVAQVAKYTCKPVCFKLDINISLETATKHFNKMPFSHTHACSLD